MLLRYLLESKAGKEAVVTKLKNLESSVSTGRKCKYPSLEGQSSDPGIYIMLSRSSVKLTAALPGDPKKVEWFSVDHSQMSPSV